MISSDCYGDSVLAEILIKSKRRVRIRMVASIALRLLLVTAYTTLAGWLAIAMGTYIYFLFMVAILVAWGR